MKPFISLAVFIVFITLVQTCYLARLKAPTEAVPIQKQAVTRFFAQKDTSGQWRLVQEIPGPQPGSATVIYGPFEDSVAVVDKLKATIRYKQEFIKADAYTGELADLNRLLSKITGAPDVTLPKSKEDLTQAMPGKWAIISGKDSLKVNVTTFLTVAGPGIEGAIEAIDNKSILIKNVLPSDTKFDFINRNVFESQAFRMVRY